MDTLHFLFTALSFLSLLLISSSIYVLATRFRIPYTVSLVAFGILIGELAPIITGLNFLDDFKLTPEILLYIFLPVLLFESAYNLKFRDLTNNIGSISLLAIVSLFISAILIGGGLYYLFDLIGMPISFLTALLFGSLISATDPVSVLALFKELGAPKRLTLIFEGESLFNDGTALALFLVVLSFFEMDTNHANLLMESVHHFGVVTGFDTKIAGGILSFISMVAVGILFGGGIGLLFSRSLSFFGKNKILELTLTVLLAHLTFILADLLNHFILPVSGVIATTIAAIVVGNYGRYKLSHETRATMNEYWEFFAHISNSIVFLLVGVMIVSLHISWGSMIIPIILAIVVIVIARAISVYGVIIPWNATKMESNIPMSWMHLLSWGSLRGSLAIVMALLIPNNLMMPWADGEISIQSFILALTVGSIIFTTFIKATTIVPLIKKLNIDALSTIDTVSHIESKILFLLGVIRRIESIGKKGYFQADQKQKLENIYKKSIENANKELQEIQRKYSNNIDDTMGRVVSLYALHIERASLLELFTHGEIDEVLLRYQLEKIEGQIDRIEEGKTQLKDEVEKATVYPWTVQIMERWIRFFEYTKYKKYELDFLKHRTRIIILEKVLRHLQAFDNIETFQSHRALEEIRSLYTNLLEIAIKKGDKLRSEHPSIRELEAELVHHTILEQETEEVEEMIEYEIISKKVGGKLLKEIL